nr:hypothetical protein [Tanacetum cinerariifolium]
MNASVGVLFIVVSSSRIISRLLASNSGYALDCGFLFRLPDDLRDNCDFWRSSNSSGSSSERGYLNWKDHGEVHEAAPLGNRREDEGIYQHDMHGLLDDLFPTLPMEGNNAYTSEGKENTSLNTEPVKSDGTKLNDLLKDVEQKVYAGAKYTSVGVLFIVVSSSRIISRLLASNSGYALDCGFLFRLSDDLRDNCDFWRSSKSSGSSSERGYLNWKDHGEVPEAAPLGNRREGEGIYQHDMHGLLDDLFPTLPMKENNAYTSEGKENTSLNTEPVKSDGTKLNDLLKDVEQKVYAGAKYTWKDFDEKNPEFATDPRNVRLALASGGFNPFKTMNVSYSIWPVIVILYNLPP